MKCYPEQLLAVIAAPTSEEKARLLDSLKIDVGNWAPPPLPRRPGRPPHYRESDDLPRRRRTLKHAPTRNRFLEAIHHIELSAIDLAVLCCLRAPDMDEAFHREQLTVAREEAMHAGLLEALLASRGLPPGTDPIHHRLWDAALAAADLGEHLVVVPRFLEARGLDVSADVLPRLRELDPEAHAVIQRIYDDEVGHVGIGTRWHRTWCEKRGLDPTEHFRTVVERHFSTQLPSPWELDRRGRGAAGFTEAELAVLEIDQNGKSGEPGGRSGRQRAGERGSAPEARCQGAEPP